MIGPVPTAPGGCSHILEEVDKFTQWIKYKPITKISSDRAVDFICDILHRFGFPNTIIIGLGISLHNHFGNSVRVLLSILSMCRLLTRGPIARSSISMA